jgi:citrate synthase
MTDIERPGLEGVVAAVTRLSDVDGAAGRLRYVGHPVEDLAGERTFEEVLWLLWRGSLPSPAERAALQADLAAHRALAPETVAVLGAAAQRGVAPMDALRMAAATLDLVPGDASQAPARVVSGVASIVAAYARLSEGLEPVLPDPSLGHVADFLRRATGEAPSAARVRALETYLITVADHGLNASTFTARVIASTGSGTFDAVVGAIGALKGPLHGGAPGPALDMVREIGRLDRAEAEISRRLAAGERLMGFGHRVYRVRDPRADVLGRAARTLFAAGEGDPALFALATGVEEIALRALAAHRPARSLKTNVEFYTALLLDGVGFAPAWFSPVFAVGRVAGWTAHVAEQRREGRLIRPSARYVGP